MGWSTSRTIRLKIEVLQPTRSPTQLKIEVPQLTYFSMRLKNQVSQPTCFSIQLKNMVLQPIFFSIQSKSKMPRPVFSSTRALVQVLCFATFARRPGGPDSWRRCLMNRMSKAPTGAKVKRHLPTKWGGVPTGAKAPPPHTVGRVKNPTSNRSSATRVTACQTGIRQRPACSRLAPGSRRLHARRASLRARRRSCRPSRA